MQDDARDHGEAGAVIAANRQAAGEIELMIPIAPGQTEAWIRTHEELMGPQYEEYAASRRRFGIASQISFLQRTPMGDFELIRLVGPDVGDTLHKMSASTDPWDIRWRALTNDLHGVDFAQGTSAFPQSEPVFWMESGDASGAQPFMFAGPVRSAAAARDLAGALMGARNTDYVRARARIGVRRESVFLQSVQGRHVLVFYWLADNPADSLRQFLESTDPMDRWLRSEAGGLHPLALDLLGDTVAANTLAVQFPRDDWPRPPVAGSFEDRP